MIRVLIADDHKLFREGIKSLLKEENGITVEVEVSNGAEILQKLESQTIDIVLMDIDMPQMNGITATHIIKEKFPDIKILVLSSYSELKFILDVMRAGASGYLVKDAENMDLVTAIRTLVQGNTYFSHKIAENLFTHLRESPENKAELPEDIHLTEREKEILQLIAGEYTNQEIADRLFISTNTVFTHRKNLLKKFNARNTAGLIKYASTYGFFKIN